MSSPWKKNKTASSSIFKNARRIFIISRRACRNVVSTRRAKFAAAATLIEATVAMAVLTIAILGAMSYEFHANKDAQIARAQIAATRTAQLLLEDWKSTGGSDEYNPTFLDLGFSSALNIPSDFDYDQSLGSPLNDAVYAITINDVPMLVMLVWADIAYDTTAEIKLRQLAAIVECRATSEETNYQWLQNVEPVILVTYARVDASGG
jgi:hypothetical protein